MRTVFLGLMPRVTTPTDFLVNRARRSELPGFLTMQMAGALCVSDDSGEDPDRAREAGLMLYSLKTGGLLETTMHDGRDCVSPAALGKVSGRLAAAGFFGEGAQIWAKVPTQIARDEADYQVDRETAIVELERMGYQSASVILTHPGRNPWLMGTEGASPGSRWWLALVAVFKLNATMGKASVPYTQHDHTTTSTGKIVKVRAV